MNEIVWEPYGDYLDTYWSRWPGVWYHGDWASVDNPQALEEIPVKAA